MINRKVEERLSGKPPEILIVLKQDPHVRIAKNELYEVLEKNFAAVKSYWQRLKPIEEFYLEDMASDDQIMRKETQCDQFRKWYFRYAMESETINKVADYQALGIFFITLERFKEAALLAPRKKQDVLESVMPASVWFGFFIPILLASVI